MDHQDFLAGLGVPLLSQRHDIADYGGMEARVVTLPAAPPSARGSCVASSAPPEFTSPRPRGPSHRCTARRAPRHRVRRMKPIDKVAVEASSKRRLCARRPSCGRAASAAHRSRGRSAGQRNMAREDRSLRLRLAISAHGAVGDDAAICECAIAGLSVWNGRRPGSSAFNAPGSSEKLAPRFCISTPVAGSTTPSRIPNRATGCRRRQARMHRRCPSRRYRPRRRDEEPASALVTFSGADPFAGQGDACADRSRPLDPGTDFEIAVDGMRHPIRIGDDAVAHLRTHAW